MKSKLPLTKILNFALLLALSFLLTACSPTDLPVIGEYIGKILPGGGPSSSGPVTLTMWGLWENPEVINDLISQYQEINPNVTINYEDRSVVKPLVSYKERVYKKLPQEDSPDIVRVHNSWVPSMTDLLAPMPQSLMGAEDYANTFYPVAVESAVSSGKIYAVPLFYDGIALVYNKEHFKEVGQQAPPTAWEEFRRLARDLSLYSEDELIRAGAAMGSAENIDHFTDIIGLMWVQANVSIPEDIDSKRARDALSFYTNFVLEDYVWDRSFPEATTAFANGQVSMIFVPSWKILDILEASPGLDIGVARVPQVSSEEPVSWGSFWMDGVSATSSHPKEAWDFLNFLIQKDQQLSYYSQSSNYRPFGAPYSRKDLADELSLNDYLRPYILDAPSATSAEIANRAGNNRQQTALREAVESILEGADIAAALTQAKGKIAR